MADRIASNLEPSNPVKTAAARRPAIPSPGTIFDPLARALEVIGDRWSLVLVRHLLGGPKGFQELRLRTGIAPRVLSARLRQLAGSGFVESVRPGSRSAYAVTDRGRSLEPIISAIARWWTHDGIDVLEIDAAQFTDTSPQSILESLPFLLREEEARGANVTFEIRLNGDADGTGGGVWSVRIADGTCEVERGFAEHADVRYTADARAWCAVALGLADARQMVERGLLVKEGGRQAMDHYFHQVSREVRARSRGGKSKPAAGDVSGPDRERSAK